jgi:hypothetical protein
MDSSTPFSGYHSNSYFSYFMNEVYLSKMLWVYMEMHGIILPSTGT